MDSEVQRAALLSHTMAAYISTLNKSLVRRVAMQLVSDTTLWLSEIFRYMCIHFSLFFYCFIGLLCVK